jgi:Uma2 family endonuclease
LDILVNPNVIVEVISPSTAAYDRGLKLKRYLLNETLKDILYIERDEMRVEHYAKQPDGSWNLTIVTGADEVVVTSINCRLSLIDVYDGIDFSKPRKGRSFLRPTEEQR